MSTRTGAEDVIDRTSTAPRAVRQAQGGHPERMLRSYRAMGADLPWGDPRAAHGVAMEGYFWRFTQVATGRVVVALCGVSRSAQGRWATLAVAGHPGGFTRTAVTSTAGADTRGLGVHAGDAFVAEPGGLRRRPRSRRPARRADRRRACRGRGARSGARASPT